VGVFVGWIALSILFFAIVSSIFVVPFGFVLV